MKNIDVEKMLRVIIIGTCMLFGIPSHAQDHSIPTARTLSQVLWDIGVVDQDAADTARNQGNDPLSLIELPRSANWIRGLANFEMREVSMVIPGWFVFDSSGYRPETTLSVWCDRTWPQGARLNRGRV